jgi:hypothetical protein
MSELVSRGLVALWWVCIILRCLAGEMCAMAYRWGNTPPRLTRSTPRGLEWRAIRRVGPRVVAFRMQVVIV